MINNFWYAVAMLVGTIVGVGIFGLPYAAWSAGFAVEVLYLFMLFFVFVSLHLMFGEIILRTRASHRLGGYAKIYLGSKAGKVVMLTTIIGTLGSMTVYILIGGKFLFILLHGFLNTQGEGYFIFWIILSSLIVFGLKAIKQSEMVMLVFVAFAVSFLFFSGLDKIQFQHFLRFDMSNFFLPYGVTLFALSGISAIPAIRDVLKLSEKKLKKAIIFGTAIPILLYLLFIILVVGVSGAAISQDAISGLQNILGGPAVFVSALFGLMITATSYVIIGSYLKNALTYDLGMRKIIALLIVVVAPIILAIASNVGFIQIIGLLGALIGGTEALFLIFTYKKAQTHGDRNPEYTVQFSKLWLYILSILFVFGIVYTLVTVIL